MEIKTTPWLALSIILTISKNMVSMENSIIDNTLRHTGYLDENTLVTSSYENWKRDMNTLNTSNKFQSSLKNQLNSYIEFTHNIIQVDDTSRSAITENLNVVMHSRKQLKTAYANLINQIECSGCSKDISFTSTFFQNVDDIIESVLKNQQLLEDITIQLNQNSNEEDKKVLEREKAKYGSFLKELTYFLTDFTNEIKELIKADK